MEEEVFVEYMYEGCKKAVQVSGDHNVSIYLERTDVTGRKYWDKAIHSNIELVIAQLCRMLVKEREEREDERYA